MSLEGNKILAAVLVAGVVFVGAGITTNTFLMPSHADGEAGAKHFPVPELPEGDAGVAAASQAFVVPDITDLIASADLGAGKTEFDRQCGTCHIGTTADGAHGTGPNLWHVVTRDIASAEGFGYSDALQALEGSWDDSKLNEFLYKPKSYVKGTTMTFLGQKDDAKRANIIAYLNSLQ